MADPNPSQPAGVSQEATPELERLRRTVRPLLIIMILLGVLLLAVSLGPQAWFSWPGYGTGEPAPGPTTANLVKAPKKCASEPDRQQDWRQEHVDDEVFKRDFQVLRAVTSNCHIVEMIPGQMFIAVDNQGGGINSWWASSGLVRVVPYRSKKYYAGAGNPDKILWDTIGRTEWPRYLEAAPCKSYVFMAVERATLHLGYLGRMRVEANGLTRGPEVLNPPGLNKLHCKSRVTA